MLKQESIQSFNRFNQESLREKNYLVMELKGVFKVILGKENYEEFCNKYFNMKPLANVQDIIDDASAIEADELESRFSEKMVYVYQNDDGKIEELSNNYLNLLYIAFLQYEEDHEQANFSYQEAYDILDYRNKQPLYDNDNIQEMYDFLDKYPNGKFKFRASTTDEEIKDPRMLKGFDDHIDIELDG